MKDLTLFDRWRLQGGGEAAMRNDPANAKVSGAFGLRLKEGGASFIVVASNGDGWDHVSVSCRDGEVQRCPTWMEMDAIKRIFFKDLEVAMQLHVPPADHVNNHPYTLHLWRPHGMKRAIPLPPKEFV